MRRNIVVLLAIALVSVVESAGATIVYNVSVIAIGETVTGTITTDGHLGPLAAVDILSWTLRGGPFPATPLLTGSSGPLCTPPCGITANPDGSLVQSGVGGATFSDQGWDIFFGFVDMIIFVPIGQPGYPDVFFHLDEGYVIATAAIAFVPEPSTVLLIGIALACLGVAWKRSRGRQSAAV